MIKTKNKNVRRRDYRKLKFFGLLMFVAAFSFAFLAQMGGKLEDDTNAANLANFNPGYIISDYQMENYASMSEAEIQNFLKSKNSCNNTTVGRNDLAGTKVDYLSESSPPRTWHIADGHFVCMADEVFDGGTAAHIIWQAAQDYKINPQVLIVLLEKEQSLVSDTFPHSQQYRSATGYGCPDSAPCSEKYYGLQNQVRNAASLFRTVLDGGWTNYPLGNNYVQYNPNPACGGSVVNIQNLATSALYRYTPYQPNAAALAGWNDGCGAYGNRNFYSYFENWFGGITNDGKPSLDILLSTNRVADESSELSLKYKSHLEYYGWLDWVNGGVMSGSAGYSLRMEALSIELDSDEGSIEYRAHSAYYGWMNWVKNGEVAGTSGESLQMEAVQIKLTGALANMYDVYYRAHVAEKGWMDWVKNGEVAGTTGESKRMEAIQIKLVKKVQNIGLEYLPHVAYYGWMDWVKNGEVAGTTGEEKRMEAIRIKLPDGLKGGVRYKAHVAYYGWLDWVKNGEIAGTTGEEKRMEAIQIELTDGLQDKYDVYYRAHVAYYGWLDWVKNGEIAGTTGESLRLEALQIELVEK